MARRVGLFALDGVQSLDVTGPAEVIALANVLRPKHSEPFVLDYISIASPSVKTHAGLTLGGFIPFAEIEGGFDTIVFSGGDEHTMIAAMTNAAFLDWVRIQSGKARRTASVCVGALLLGAAGLLDGRRATTHWKMTKLLRLIAPTADVDENAVFVSDSPIYTSAGVTTGIDLVLSFVEADLGAETARAIAKELILFLRRPGGQSQFSAGINIREAATPKIKELVASILDDPRGDLAVATMASRVGQSERTFARTFLREMMMPPAQFIDLARVERSKFLLETSDWPLARIAEMSGFSSLDSLHRSFLKRTGITPGQYRDRFQ